MNPDDPDNHLPQAISDQLLSNAVEKSKRLGKSSRKASKVEIAGVAGVMSSVVPPVRKGIDLHADRRATCHLFCSVTAFVPNTLLHIPHKVIELADNTMITAAQQQDVLLPFMNVNLRYLVKLIVLNLGYNPASVGLFAEKGTHSLFC